MPQWPGNPALFLDLDGTLLEFALDPAEVEVPERVREILARLPSAADGAVAFVSGRTMADLDRLLGSGRFPLAAVHGLERRDAEGGHSTTLKNERALDRMHDKLERLTKKFPGTLLEHKDITLALHYRRRPELESELIAQVQDELSRTGSDLRLLRGNRVLEIKPETENKGTAIRAFMQEPPFRGRTPVFVGDDVTDEDGFRAVNELGGVSVKVGSGASCAAYRLADTDAVIDWLGQLVTEAEA